MQDIESAWKTARQTKTLETVVGILQSTMGPRERCMYCVDSHGSDIDHFWPKATYPNRAFLWPNMLLCCTECGRFKGIRFPLSGAGDPMLVDPSAENPWEYLDFDPDTGNLTARYDVKSGAPSPKGESTVQVLQLDRREGMAEGYRQTYRRIVSRVRGALAGDAIDPQQFAQDLQQADDHGLLGWCFGPVGRRLPPFAELQRKVPDAWDACVAEVISIEGHSQ
ncbi:MAG: hypothetical protein LBQ20_02725 [Rhodanobacter sp.]|nr:hypothetical protein [Rhodanobacter sp.]